LGAVFFYHLTRSPIEDVVTMLLQRSLDVGWRVAVQMRSADLMMQLDDRLWTHPAEGFLPHGIAGGADDARQPVLLACDAAAGNNPACVISLEGVDLSAEQARALERGCILFDGHDAAAVEHARDQWRSLTRAGIEARYWAQEDGRWVMKASSQANATGM